MKKILCSILICALALSIVACSPETTETTSSDAPAESIAPTVSVSPTEAPTEMPTEVPTAAPTETPIATLAPVVSEPVEPDILKLVINSDGTVSNGVAGGPSVESFGKNKTVSVDPATGLNVVTFPSTDSVYDVQIGEYYGDIGTSFSMEVYFKLDAIPSSGYQGIVENCEAGGLGLYVFDDASIKFYLSLDGTYAIVTAPEKAQVGQWYHCVCVWDGDLVQIYMDGKLADEYMSNFAYVTFPSVDTAWYLSIAGCCSAGGHGNGGICGSVGICNLYTTPLTAEQIAAIYNDLMQ